MRYATVVALFLAALLPMPSAADVAYRDRRDQGPLDIIGVKVKRVDDWSLAAEIHFAHEVTLSSLRPPNYLVLDIDHSGNGRSDHWLFIAPYGGRFAVYSHDVNEKADYCCDLKVRKVGRRTLRVRFPQFSNYTWFRGGHLFRVAAYYEGAGCARGCFDVAPDRGWAINDFTPPRISGFDVPIAAYDNGRPQVRLGYRLSDQGFSELGPHRILVRDQGSADWSVATTRPGGGDMSYVLELSEGQTAAVKMVARDRAHNITKTGVSWLTAPIDEASVGRSEFFGLWQARSTPGAYMETDHVSISPVDQFRFTGTGTHYCLLFATGPEYGIALMSIGDTAWQIEMHAETAEPLQRACVAFSDRAERSVTVEEYEGRINVDGFWVDDIYDEDTGGTHDDRPDRRFETTT